MSPPRSWPGKLPIPKLAGRVIVDTYRGQQRMRSWPRKRGKNVPHNVAVQNARFAEANRLAKRADGLLQAQAIDAVKHSGLYPRDLLVKEILRGVIDVTTEEGVPLTLHRPFVETVKMQGFGLRLTANQNVPAGTNYNVIWPLPEFDSADFWNVASPDRITIPQFVTHMVFSAGMQFLSSVSGNTILVLRRIAPTVQTFALTTTGTADLATVTTGIIAVSEGDQFAFTMNSGLAGTMIPPQTFFNGFVVGAE